MTQVNVFAVKIFKKESKNNLKNENQTKIIEIM